MNKCDITNQINENKDDLTFGSNFTLFSANTPVLVQNFSERVNKDQTAIPKQNSIKQIDLNHDIQPLTQLIEKDSGKTETKMYTKTLNQRDILK